MTTVQNRFFLRRATACALLFAAAAATQGEMKWIDGRDLPIEGRAFDDTEHYYDRLPSNVTANVNSGVR